MASEEPAGVAGIWYPPRSSAGRRARLTVAASGRVELHDAAGATLAAADAAALAVSDRVGSIARRLGFPDGGVFETEDNDGVDCLLGHRVARTSRLFAELERFRPRLALFVVIVIALSVGLYRFAVPLLVEVAVAVTPPVVPRIMSQGALASLDETFLTETTLETGRRDEISAGFARLTAAAMRGPDGYALHFRDGGAIGPNAFALPDGTIVITDQLIRLAGGDLDAVLGVLAHEIGHVDHDHSLRRLYRAAGVAGLIMLIGGDVGSGVEDALVSGAALLSLSFSRDQERDADRYSIEIMASAGRDPTAIVRFFELMQREFGDHGAAAFLTTHPATAERIEEAKRYAAEVLAQRAR